MDVIRAAHLAREGLALSGAQKFADAVKCYEEALAHADPEHFETPLYHQQFATVLVALGRDADALGQYQNALALEQSQNGDDDAEGPVALARYFLAEHHAKMREPAAGLDVLAPSLVIGGKYFEALLCTIQAECLWQLGRIDEARAAAQHALNRARSDIQREKIRERFALRLGQLE